MARSDRMQKSAEPTAVRGFVPPQNDAERFLMRHVEDMIQLVQKRGIARYSDFLSDREQLLAKAAIPKGADVVVRFEGGMPDAERKILCLEPHGFEPSLPVACVCITAKLTAGAKAPQHKDYLGSLMGLSFERACLGDIVISGEREETAYLFVLESVLPIVLQELTSIGRVSVRTQELPLDQLPVLGQTARTVQSTTVSSLRLDAVLAAMVRCSRGMAAEYIAAGRVEINHLPANSAHASVYAQDIFTVRGKGRFQLVSLQGKSKKDRFIIEYFQF
ncbi:MAG: YlmH/Sll1252 family protein [Faecalibacterium sp.]